jgi:AcrR family transcriptional regulator
LRIVIELSGMPRRSTRDRLLAAAVSIFTTNGYRDATIGDVCEAADANIASVNYHFGSKENLFRHVLRESFHSANSIYPIHGNLPADAPAERRLHAFMSALIRRNFDSGPAGDFNRIMLHHGTREAAPDELVHSEVAELEGNTLMAILAELLHTRSQELLTIGKLNVIGLCVFPCIAHLLRNHLFPEDSQPTQLKRFIDRQHAFAVAGLSALAPASG